MQGNYNAQATASTYPQQTAAPPARTISGQTERIHTSASRLGDLCRRLEQVCDQLGGCRVAEGKELKAATPRAVPNGAVDYLSHVGDDIGFVVKDFEAALDRIEGAI